MEGQEGNQGFDNAWDVTMGSLKPCRPRNKLDVCKPSSAIRGKFKLLIRSIMRYKRNVLLLLNICVTIRGVDK